MVCRQPLMQDACPCCCSLAIRSILHMQASAGFASVLQDLGFTVNSMGRETRLDLATYGFTGGWCPRTAAAALHCHAVLQKPRQHSVFEDAFTGHTCSHGWDASNRLYCAALYWTLLHHQSSPADP